MKTTFNSTYFKLQPSEEMQKIIDFNKNCVLITSSSIQKHKKIPNDKFTFELKSSIIANTNYELQVGNNKLKRNVDSLPVKSGTVNNRYIKTKTSSSVLLFNNRFILKDDLKPKFNPYVKNFHHKSAKSVSFNKNSEYNINNNDINYNHYNSNEFRGIQRSNISNNNINSSTIIKSSSHALLKPSLNKKEINESKIAIQNLKNETGSKSKRNQSNNHQYSSGLLKLKEKYINTKNKIIKDNERLESWENKTQTKKIIKSVFNITDIKRKVYDSNQIRHFRNSDKSSFINYNFTKQNKSDHFKTLSFNDKNVKPILVYNIDEISKEIRKKNYKSMDFDNNTIDDSDISKKRRYTNSTLDEYFHIYNKERNLELAKEDLNKIKKEVKKKVRNCTRELEEEYLFIKRFYDSSYKNRSISNCTKTHNDYYNSNARIVKNYHFAKTKDSVIKKCKDNRKINENVSSNLKIRIDTLDDNTEDGFNLINPGEKNETLNSFKSLKSVKISTTPVKNMHNISNPKLLHLNNNHINNNKENMNSSSSLSTFNSFFINKNKLGRSSFNHNKNYDNEIIKNKNSYIDESKDNFNNMKLNNLNTIESNKDESFLVDSKRKRKGKRINSIKKSLILHKRSFSDISDANKNFTNNFTKFNNNVLTMNTIEENENMINSHVLEKNKQNNKETPLLLKSSITDKFNLTNISNFDNIHTKANLTRRSKVSNVTNTNSVSSRKKSLIYNKNNYINAKEILSMYYKNRKTNELKVKDNDSKKNNEEYNNIEHTDEKMDNENTEKQETELLTIKRSKQNLNLNNSNELNIINNKKTVKNGEIEIVNVNNHFNLNNTSSINTNNLVNDSKFNTFNSKSLRLNNDDSSTIDKNNKLETNRTFINNKNRIKFITKESVSFSSRTDKYNGNSKERRNCNNKKTTISIGKNNPIRIKSNKLVFKTTNNLQFNKNSTLSSFPIDSKTYEIKSFNKLNMKNIDIKDKSLVNNNANNNQDTGQNQVSSSILNVEHNKGNIGSGIEKTYDYSEDKESRVYKKRLNYYKAGIIKKINKLQQLMNVNSNLENQCKLHDIYYVNS